MNAQYRVKNMCHYDIGITLPNGISKIIPAGGFQMMTADDIAYVESICTVNKFFSQRMLVPFNTRNEEIKLEEVGMCPLEEISKHMDDVEISMMLKRTPKKLEADLEAVTDPAELDAIARVAKTMDLPASKVKILSAKIPNYDLLDIE